MKFSNQEIKKLCKICCERKALFQRRGVVKRDRQHTLCFKCFRSTISSIRAANILAMM